MSGNSLYFFLLSFLLLFSLRVEAQFYVSGNEKTNVKWSITSTSDYNFICPAPYDSLAKVYAREWEKWKIPVGNSIGRYPNEMYSSRLDVVLHPFSAYSNGMVVWTPKRMEMYTCPDMYDPDPMPWVTQLAIHEQRHVSQMQFTKEKVNRVFTFLNGELLAGPLSLWYFDPALFEGDAVTAETALTHSGRARTADFLEYFRAATLEDDFRNYERWRYGSQKLYTPDYYKVGYLATGGARAVFSYPDFMRDYYNSYLPYYLFVKDKFTVNVKEGFTEILSTQDLIWREDEVSRAPFQQMEKLTGDSKFYRSYSGLTVMGGKIYAKCTGLVDIPHLISFDISTGKERSVSATSASSRFDSDSLHIFWTELRPDPRWEMQSSSVVKSYNGLHTRILGSRNKRYYNPKAASNGDVLVCECGYDGADYIVLLSGKNGEEKARYRAPDGLTPFEAVSLSDGTIYCVAQGPDGQAIYRVPDFECILKGGYIKINNLHVNHSFTLTGIDVNLLFTSDRTGVNEFYGLDADTGEVYQLTNLRLGGKDFCMDDVNLFFTYLHSSGRQICRTPLDSLPVRLVDFSEHYSYPLEDILSQQEETFSMDKSREKCYNVSDISAQIQNISVLQGKDSLDKSKVTPDIHPAKHYSKAAHLLKFHSWAPLYIDYDAVSDLSMESLETGAGLGATAFFQNTLGTFSGSVGYNAALDSTYSWNHILMAQAAYRGLYPVFEDKFLFNATTLAYTNEFRTYIPLNFSSGGWTRGVVPYYKLSFNYVDSGWCYAHTQLGVRAYVTQPTASSCRFPKWGIGTNVSLKNLAYLRTPALTLYGYLPGPAPDQGFALNYSHDAEGLYIRDIAFREPVVYSDAVSAAWSIPCFSVDWNGLSPVVYVRIFEFTPRASFSHYRLDYSGPRVESEDFIDSYSVSKIGTDFTVLLGNFLFIPYTIRFGVGAYYVADTSGNRSKPYDINLILSVDI